MESTPGLQVLSKAQYIVSLIERFRKHFRRIDDDRGKSYELGQSAIKCMRGILECWMKQSSRVELFKKNQSNRFALHCKFHLDTGDEIFKDEDYNHLQVISL